MSQDAFWRTEDEQNDILVSSDNRGLSSDEFKESYAAVHVDPFDLTSWMIVVGEAEAGRSGDLDIDRVFNMLLQYFPRTPRFWRRFSELQKRDERFDQALLTLQRGAHLCFDVDLWFEYLTQSSFGSELDSDRCKLAIKEFECAVSQIGMDIYAGKIWKNYISFLEQSRSQLTDSFITFTDIRKLYSRALNVSLLDSDSIFEDYVVFEKTNQDQSSEVRLQEVSKVLPHLKSILPERRKKMSDINLDKVSCPPSLVHTEIRELRSWNNWISFEHRNWLKTKDASLISYIRLAFQKCINCFYYNPEVWFSFAIFEKELGNDKSMCHLIIRKATEIFPKNHLFPLFQAEFLEEEGNIPETHQLLQNLFELDKTYFTFTIYQRFLYRQFGIAAARLLFSSTYQFRVANPVSGVKLHVAHANFEFQISRQPDVALRVLTTASLKTSVEAVSYSPYVDLLLKVLIGTGRVNEARWVLNNAITLIQFIDDRSPKLQLLDRNENTEFLNSFLESKHSLPVESVKLCKILYEKYLEVERNYSTNSSFIRRLTERIRELETKLTSSERRKPVKLNSPFYYVGLHMYELIQRYKHFNLEESQDVLDMENRCIQISTEQEVLQYDEIAELADSTDTRLPNSNLSAQHLPPFLREFMSKLPLHLGPIPDTDLFVRQLKTVILPPRPLADDVVSDFGIKGNEPYTPHIFEDSFRKRQRLL